jgi:RNA polymerase sigma-70 factor (ECF subfamily)
VNDPSRIAEVFRAEWPRIVATLMKDLGELDLAEEVTQEAFFEAARRWPSTGRPDAPGAWLITTARRKAIDRLRRARRLDERLALLHERSITDQREPSGLVDDQLALLLGCCHPALDTESQIALTLRSVGGLSVAQIAKALMVSEVAMARRIGRAKTKIKAARIPFSLPDRATLVKRLDVVRRVVFLIFTEGHTSATGATLVRGDLCDEAIWLGELLVELVPDDAEVHGLAALVLLTDARRATRLDAEGNIVLLEDQDRSAWDRSRIDRGLAHLATGYELHDAGPFQLQAAIAAVHATATSFAATDWPLIVRLFDALVRREPTPVVALNRAVAVSYANGAENGLRVLAPLADELATYPYFHSTRAELLLRAGRSGEASAAFDDALRWCRNDAERRHLATRRAVAAAKAAPG